MLYFPSLVVADTKFGDARFAYFISYLDPKSTKFEPERLSNFVWPLGRRYVMYCIGGENIARAWAGSHMSDPLQLHTADEPERLRIFCKVQYRCIDLQNSR
jgi:hypothetical protein